MPETRRGRIANGMLAAALVLLAFAALGETTYKDAQIALGRADFDTAIAIFEELGAAGDETAAASAVTLSALTQEDRMSWTLQQGASAVEAGDLDEAERLFRIALDAGQDGAQQLLDIVAEAKQEIAIIDAKIAALQAENPDLRPYCTSIVRIENGLVGNAREECPMGATTELQKKHRRDVAAAKEQAVADEVMQGSISVWSDAENERVIIGSGGE